MKIYRPFLTNYLVQRFGEAKTCAAVNSNGKVYWPYKIINKVNGLCREGYSDFYRTVLGMFGHNGEDWAVYRKEKIYFPVLADTQWYGKNDLDDGGGIGIDVISRSPIAISTLPQYTGDQAKSLWKELGGKIYVKFRFHHAMLNIPESGSEIRAGFLIQLSDSTGASTGDHCHWSMKFCDSNGETLDKDNGFKGAVPYNIFFTNKFILDELEDISKRLASDIESVVSEESLMVFSPLKSEYMPSQFDRIIAAINTFLNALRGK